MSITKVAVTGTKGKTSVTNLIADVLSSYDFNRVLHVNTTGHFVNGKRRSTLDDSKRTWGLVPSVAPGRYLFEFFGADKDEKLAAVLETSIGCSTLSGMGYAMHNVGIFLNVYEDHIGSSDRISSQQDIVDAKDFIVKRVLRDGYAVLNTDDSLVLSLVDRIPVHRGVRPMFYGTEGVKEKLPDDMKDAAYVTLEDTTIVYVEAGHEKIHRIVDIHKLVWTFDGLYHPSISNALAVVAGVIGAHGGVIPEKLGDILAETRLDPYGGRLTQLRAKNGARIIADYAHEKKSLTEIARLAHKLKGEHGKVIGVVRLAYDRTDDLIRDTGETIAPEYDAFVVYDKIDGHFKDASKNLQFNRFTQEVGVVSEKFSNALKSKNEHVERIIREDHAIERAAELADPDDVVIVIVNDDIERSVGFIKSAFRADFV